MWQKAYREQKSGKEPDYDWFYACPRCVSYIIARFLNDEDTRRAGHAIMASVTAGTDIVLFDRNLYKYRTDPAIAVGHFKTLADFRRQYWQALEEGLEVIYEWS